MSGFLVNPPESVLWKSNALVGGSARRHESREFVGTLSIKAVVYGTVTWTTPDGRYPVAEGCHLILNDGQRYRLEIHSAHPVQTLCAFFRPGFVGEVRSSHRSTVETLLEAGAAEEEREYPERLCPNDDAIVSRLHALKRCASEGLAEALAGEEAFLALAEALLHAHGQARREALTLGYARAATREEVFRRLNQARDRILSQPDYAFSLAELAETACLSPFHIHRLFRAAFGKAPHAFVTEVRLERASRLLRQTDLPIADIAYQTGFQSDAAFCTRFKRRYGLSPTQYRSPQN